MRKVDKKLSIFLNLVKAVNPKPSPPFRRAERRGAMKAFIAAVVAVALFAAFVPATVAEAYDPFKEIYACANAGYRDLASCRGGNWVGGVGIGQPGHGYPIGGGEYFPSPDTRESVRVTEHPGGGRTITRSPDPYAVTADGLAKVGQAAAIAAGIAAIIFLGR